MSTLNLTYSAQMMTNYLQAELISPQKKFEALQTSDGHSLLFSIGTDGVFYLFREQSGASAAGWSKTDLSSAQINSDFSGQSGVSCRTFEAGQSAQDGSLGLAMVVDTPDGDRLYLCLNQSNQDLSWTGSPNWAAYEYDSPDFSVSQLEIVNVFFCETTGNTQYIIVDIVRDPTSAVKDIARFYIDPSNNNSGSAWNMHPLPIDLEAEQYESCIGRAPRGYVDGLYTAGQAGGSGQLIFQPVINVFGDAPPTPVRLNLPGGAIPGAIASTRNSDLSTDLFVVSGKSLYYFASSNQADGAVAATLLTNDVLSNSSELAAMSHNGVITLWGRNASNQVYYTSCSQSLVQEPGSWSLPVPILSGIEEMSPYINAADGGNIIFAAGDDKVKRITQGSVSASKLWQTDDITLPVPAASPSISFHSYTTTLQVTDEQGLPPENADQITLSLSANNRCAVYINGLYYVLNQTAIDIHPNSQGALTIVESTETLNGTVFTISTETGVSVTINPMDEPFKQLTALDTSERLKSAQITEDDGTTKPLVSSSLSDDDANTVAASLGKLNQSYNQVNGGAPAPAPSSSFTPTSSASSVSAPLAPIEVTAGDLFSWLRSGVDAVIDVVEDTANSVWYFVATIAGQAYSAVLDTVDAVAGAVEWVFNAIKTGIEDLIQFIKFLFEWDDIQRTKEVLYNLIKQYLNGQVSSISTFQRDFDNLIGDVESKVNTWAGITDWSGLGSAASQPARSSASNPLKDQTSASQHLSHHLQNNVNQITIVSGGTTPDLSQSLINDLLTALQNEAGVLDNAIDQLDDLARKFSNLSVEDVLKRLVGILADGVLSSAKVVVDAVLNILIQVAQAALGLLDAKIHIPVISDILNGIGIPDISFLDLFCWIAAVSYTVVYKDTQGVAPFPDNSDTSLLMSASSLDDLQQAFTSPSIPETQVAVAQPVVMDTAVDSSGLSVSTQNAVFVAGHAVAGFCTLMSDFVSTFEAAEETGDNSFSTPSAVLGVVCGGAVGMANFLVPKKPIQDVAVSRVSTATTGIRVISKIIFSGPMQSKFSASEGIMKNLEANDGRATGSIIDALLTLPALACTGWHFYELSRDAASDERTDAILEEVSNLTSYISRVSYALAVNDEDPESKSVEIGIMAGANIAYAGLQTAEAAVG